MTITVSIDAEIAEVVMHHPPVNSITVGDTWKIHNDDVDGAWTCDAKLDSLVTNDHIRVFIFSELLQQLVLSLVNGIGRGVDNDVRPWIVAIFNFM